MVSLRSLVVIHFLLLQTTLAKDREEANLKTGPSDCGQSCHQCLNSNESITCLICLPGHRLQKGVCVQCALQGCKLCSSNTNECERCKIGYFNSTLPGTLQTDRMDLVSNCTQCSNHCQQCFDEKCSICKTGYQIVEGFDCVPSDNLSTIYCILIFGGIFLLGLFIFFKYIHSSGQESQKSKKENTHKKDEEKFEAKHRGKAQGQDKNPKSKNQIIGDNSSSKNGKILKSQEIARIMNELETIPSNSPKHITTTVNGENFTVLVNNVPEVQYMRMPCNITKVFLVQKKNSFK